MVSSVPKGSGLSSSAAFEVLIGTMLNEFFGEGRRTPVEKTLREVDEEDFLSALPQIRAVTGDRAVNRAFHVYAENRRVQAEEQALRAGDFESFLSLVRDSGCSSAMFLQNIIATGQTASQELMVTIALCESVLAGKGEDSCHVVTIRPAGGVRLG